MAQEPSFMMDDERRVFERFPAVFPARFQGSEDQFGNNVFLRDASAEGGKILSRHPFSLFDQVTLEVQLPDNPMPLKLEGKVVWGKRHRANLWDFGIQFPQVNLVQLSRLYNIVSPPTTPADFDQKFPA